MDRLYNGYPPMTPTTPDIYAQSPYARFPSQPGPTFPAPADIIVKSETDTPVTQGYFPNGALQITDSLKAHGYYTQPQYTTPVYSAVGPISSSTYTSEQGIPPPPSYDQFRMTPPVTKDGGFEQTTEPGQVYWGSEEEGVNSETYESEQPTKRARYSNEDFSS